MHFLGLLYIAVLAFASAAPALGGPSMSYVALPHNHHQYGQLCT